MVAPSRTFIVSALAAGVLASTPVSAANRPVPGTTCPTFPANSWWHADISSLPVHPRSNQWMAHMSPTRRLHPDFGPSYGEQPAPYGIPDHRRRRHASKSAGHLRHRQ